jgi:type I restriction enzyme S subunit
MRVPFNHNIVDPDFIHGYLTGHAGRQEFLKHSRRSAVQYNINTKEFARIRVPVPPIELQRAYLRHLKQIRLIEGKHQRGLADADDLFNSLVQRAFRGEL